MEQLVNFVYLNEYEIGMIWIGRKYQFIRNNAHCVYNKILYDLVAFILLARQIGDNVNFTKKINSKEIVLKLEKVE